MLRDDCDIFMALIDINRTRFSKIMLRLFDPWSNFGTCSKTVKVGQGCTSTTTYTGIDADIFRPVFSRRINILQLKVGALI